MHENIEGDEFNICRNRECNKTFIVKYFIGVKAEKQPEEWKKDYEEQRLRNLETVNSEKEKQT